MGVTCPSPQTKQPSAFSLHLASLKLAYIKVPPESRENPDVVFGIVIPVISYLLEDKNR
jgi:hypothetical protein